MGGRVVRRREHLLVEGAQLGRGRGPELLAEQHAQAVERAQRLGVVATRGVRSHEQPVSRLAERRQLDQPARGELGPRRTFACARQQCLREQLERLELLLVLEAPVLVEPERVEHRHQRALVDVEGGLGM